MDAAFSGEGAQGGEHAPPPLQYGEVGVYRADGQRPQEHQPARHSHRRVEAGRHRKSWRVPPGAGRGPAARRFLADIVLYAPDLPTIHQAVGEFAGVFTNADGALFTETYNQLNAFFAAVPGNYAQNLRKLYLLNSNYADLSFLFTIHPGETTNPFLETKYLAVLETENATPYYLNLHNGEVAHTLMLGMTGSGKSFACNFLLMNAQKYRPKPTSSISAEVRVAHENLRRHLSQRRPGEPRLHHQPLLAAGHQGEPAISILFLPRAHRRQRPALPARLQGGAQAVGRHRAHVCGGSGAAYAFDLRANNRRTEENGCTAGRRTASTAFFSITPGTR